jgi:hypothetical protein
MSKSPSKVSKLYTYIIRPFILILNLIIPFVIIILPIITIFKVNPFIVNQYTSKCKDTIVINFSNNETYKQYHLSKINQLFTKYMIRYNLYINCDECNNNNNSTIPNESLLEMIKKFDTDSFNFYNLSNKTYTYNLDSFNTDCNNQSKIEFDINNKTIIEPHIVTIIYTILLIISMLSSLHYTFNHLIRYNSIYIKTNLSLISPIFEFLFLITKCVEIVYRYMNTINIMSFSFKIFIIYIFQFIFVFINSIIQSYFKLKPNKLTRFQLQKIDRIIQIIKLIFYILIFLSLIISFSIDFSASNKYIKLNYFITNQLKNIVKIFTIDYILFTHVINIYIYSSLILRSINMFIINKKNL